VEKDKRGAWRARGERNQIGGGRVGKRRHGEDVECKQEVVEWGEGGVLL